jgi:hypothetical protein
VGRCRLLIILLSLFPLAFAAEGCASARQASRPESPPVALPAPSPAETFRIFRRTVPPEALPEPPFSEVEADARHGRWLTLFEIDLTAPEVEGRDLTEEEDF